MFPDDTNYLALFLPLNKFGLQNLFLTYLKNKLSAVFFHGKKAEQGSKYSCYLCSTLTLSTTPTPLYIVKTCGEHWNRKLNKTHLMKRFFRNFKKDETIEFWNDRSIYRWW